MLASFLFWIGQGPLLSRHQHQLQALEEGVRMLGEREYSVRLVEVANSGLVNLTQSFNKVADILRQDHQELYQRELILDALFQHSPGGMFLLNEKMRIVKANPIAHQLVGADRKLEGYDFNSLCALLPSELGQELLHQTEGLALFEVEGSQQTFHILRRAFQIQSQTHHLILIVNMTQTLHRQETQMWKKVIRLLSHELNNSLAPISSMLHSAKILTQSSQVNPEELQPIFRVINERIQHLNQFLQRYAQFARLPDPKFQEISLQDWAASQADLLNFQLENVPDAKVVLDPAQMEQVQINLIKNAVEAGTPVEAVQVKWSLGPNLLQMEVLDNGPGLSEALIKQVTLPFFTTKQGGMGMGLALCREIVEAHGGRLSLSNRQNGGLSVLVQIPQRPLLTLKSLNTEQEP